ncbi:MAG: hypothetical protein QXR60_02685 [Candidatus Nanoarchaeia archaeon]
MKFSIGQAVDLFQRGVLVPLHMLVVSQVGTNNRAFGNSLDMCLRHDRKCPNCGEAIDTTDLHCPSCKVDFMWFERRLNDCHLCMYEWDDHSS